MLGTSGTGFVVAGGCWAYIRISYLVDILEETFSGLNITTVLPRLGGHVVLEVGLSSWLASGSMDLK